MKEFLSRFWVRRTPAWLDLYFCAGGRLRIQSTDSYLLWISWGYRAERQFTINRWWSWKSPSNGEFWLFAYRVFI